MKKRILSLVLALSMMISLFPVSALAQTPGGGTAEMAEENGETEETAGTITINSSGEPVTSGLNTDSEGYWVGNGWKYMDGAGSGLGTLTLMSGTWNLANQNAVKCYVAIDEKATVAGGTFENTVWNEAGGKISGGTFKKTVSNKGTITGGIFVGVDSGNTSVINHDAGKITGGVFKTLPNEGNYGSANKYCIEFADDSKDTLSVNDVDFDTGKVYVVGMDNEELTITANNTDLTNVNQTRNSATSSKTITFKPGSVKQESETDSSTGVYLLKLNKTITKLEIGLNGYPITTGHRGDSWTYGDSTLTLFQTNDGWDFSNDVGLQCNVKVSDGATLKGGVFNKWVANWGTIENGVYRGNVTNYNGTIKNGIFLKQVNSIGTGYDSIVQGGVFKSKPSWVANGYREHTITSYVSNRTIKVKIDGVSDFEDVGSSPFVVTKEGEGTTISVQLWESGTSGQATTIRSLNGKAIGPDNCNSSWDENTKTLTFTTPTTGNIELNGPLENAELEFESGYRTNGQYPVGTDGGKKNASGNGWEYVAGTGNELGTLTLTAGTYDLTKKQPTNSASEELHDPIVVKLTIGKDVVVTNSSCWIEGTITVQNGGTIENGEYSTKDIVIETGGTIKNGTFKGSGTEIKNSGTIWNASCSDYTKVTNGVGGVIKDGKFRYNVTNDGGTIENGEFYYKVTNNGTINGGFFRSGVDNVGNAVVGGGIFNGGTGLEGRNGISKVDVNGVNINRVNGVSAGSGWSMSYWGNIYTTCGTQLELQTLDSGYIYNLNGKTNDYNVAGLGTNTVSFKIPTENVVLNKTVTLTVQSDVEGAVSTKSERPVVINKAVLVTTDQQEGYYFAGWKVSPNLELTYNGKEADLSRNRIVFDMPAENVTLTATYAKTPKYTLTVENGQTETGETSGAFKEDEIVTVVPKPNDKIFTGWAVSDGVTLTYNDKEVDLSKEHITFNMPAKSFTLTANLEEPRTNILFNEDGTLNLEGVKDGKGDGWYYDDGVLCLDPATATEYDFTHVDPLDKTSEKLDAVKVPIQVVGSTVTIKSGTFEAKVESTAASASIQNCTFKGGVVSCKVKNCIFMENSAITSLDGAENCLFEKKPDESIATKALTEAGGATVTATLDGCAGEVSGEMLYFTGTPTLKVKVKGGTVEKANGEDVGQADENGWYTVTAAEDGNIKLTKSTPTPNPDDQPKTYTVTVKGGKINNETEVKAKKDTKLTVDVDESEVPEGMTFDVWSIRFPEGIKDTLTPSVMLHEPHMAFAMPGADITIEAQYRSSELPGEDDGPSTLGTMATVAVGGAAAGILVWQGVSLGVDSYLQLNLPKGVAVPANRRELVKLLWETAGKPEAALPSLYSDVPAEEIELQKATRWAIDNGLVKPADDSDASRFDPDRYVTKYDVFGAWLKLKKLMK